MTATLWPYLMFIQRWGSSLAESFEFTWTDSNTSHVCMWCWYDMRSCFNGRKMLFISRCWCSQRCSEKPVFHPCSVIFITLALKSVPIFCLYVEFLEHFSILSVSSFLPGCEILTMRKKAEAECTQLSATTRWCCECCSLHQMSALQNVKLAGVNAFTPFEHNALPTLWSCFHVFHILDAEQELRCVF